MLSITTLTWVLTIPILGTAVKIVRSRGSPAEASKPLQSDRYGQRRVYGERALHERTRVDAAMARIPNLRVWRGPQPKCWPERCGSLMRLTTSSGIEIENSFAKATRGCCRSDGLRTWTIKITMRSSSRAAGTMLAPTSAQALKGQGLQEGVQRARWSTRQRHWIRGRQGSSAPNLAGEDAIRLAKASAEEDAPTRERRLEMEHLRGQNAANEQCFSSSRHPQEERSRAW